jgi:hypothetical protein
MLQSAEISHPGVSDVLAPSKVKQREARELFGDGLHAGVVQLARQGNLREIHFRAVVTGGLVYQLHDIFVGHVKLLENSSRSCYPRSPHS